MAIYPQSDCAPLPILAKKQQEAVNQSFTWVFSPINPQGHDLSNPIKIEGPVENKKCGTQKEGNKERLYSVYSREQEIKVQEVRDGAAERWAGSVLRGSPIETLCLCCPLWQVLAWMHSSSTWHRSKYNKALIPLMKLTLLLKGHKATAPSLDFRPKHVFFFFKSWIFKLAFCLFWNRRRTEKMLKERGRWQAS